MFIRVLGLVIFLLFFSSFSFAGPNTNINLSIEMLSGYFHPGQNVVCNLKFKNNSNSEQTVILNSFRTLNISYRKKGTKEWLNGNPSTFCGNSFYITSDQIHKLKPNEEHCSQQVVVIGSRYPNLVDTKDDFGSYEVKIFYSMPEDLSKEYQAEITGIESSITSFVYKPWDKQSIRELTNRVARGDTGAFWDAYNGKISEAVEGFKQYIFDNKTDWSAIHENREIIWLYLGSLDTKVSLPILTKILAEKRMNDAGVIFCVKDKPADEVLPWAVEMARTYPSEGTELYLFYLIEHAKYTTTNPSVISGIREIVEKYVSGKGRPYVLASVIKACEVIGVDKTKDIVFLIAQSFDNFSLAPEEKQHIKQNLDAFLEQIK